MKKLLLAYQLSGQTIGVDITTWDSADLNGNKPFIFINDGASIPVNYVDISSIETWENFGSQVISDTQVNAQITILVSEIGIDNLDSNQLTLLSGQTETLGYGAEYQYIENTDALVTFSTSYVDYINSPVTLLGGMYRIGWTFFWSHDATNNSFEGRIQLGTDTLNEYKIEPNETGGSGVGGTDQRRGISGFTVKTLDAGVYDLKMQLATEASNTESTIYNGNFEVYRIE